MGQKGKDGEIMILYICDFEIVPENSFGLGQSACSIVLFINNIIYKRWINLVHLNNTIIEMHPKIKKKYEKNKNYHMRLRQSYGTKRTKY